MTRVRLLPVTLAHLTAFERDRGELSALLHSPIPDGWPEFPEAIPHTASVLKTNPDDAGWWMHFFFDDQTNVLVGSGGFAGRPHNGVVELGYEIAPEHRRRGYAIAAVKALLAKAAATGEVASVIAHTLAVDERSAGVLRATGFAEAGSVTDPDDGELVRWQRDLGI
jgi:ribosomal-protein-alanine N-acetyltransferase